MDATATSELACPCGAKVYALGTEERAQLCLTCGESVPVPRAMRAGPAVEERLIRCPKCSQESALPSRQGEGVDCPYCGETIRKARPTPAPRRDVERARPAVAPSSDAGVLSRIGGIGVVLILVVVSAVLRAGGSTPTRNYRPSYPSTPYRVTPSSVPRTDYSSPLYRPPSSSDPASPLYRPGQPGSSQPGRWTPVPPVPQPPVPYRPPGAPR